MKEPNMETDIVVVGGGVAGLTAASYLARAGQSVTLFERAAQLGGRAASQETQGFTFNRGIHALYTGGAATEALTELGVSYSGGSPGTVWALRQGKLYPSPVTPLALLSSRLFGLRDKLELARVLGRLPQLDTSTLCEISAEAWLERHIKRTQVREFLSAQARTLTYTAALDLVSAEVFLGKLQRLLKHPVLYLDGGWGTLVEGLRQTAQAAGVAMQSGAAVATIEHTKGRVHSVTLRNGQRVSAHAVVLALPPKDAAKVLERAQLSSLIPETTPVHIACLNVALSHLPTPQYGVVQDLEQPLFMSVQSLASRVAPEGSALVYAFKQLDPRVDTNPHDDERELEGLLDVSQPGWRERIVERQFLPHIEAVGDLPAARSGGFAGRATVRVSGLNNLFLAGDWVGLEGFLVDASVASARDATRLILQDGAVSELPPAGASVLPQASSKEWGTGIYEKRYE